MGTKRVVDTDFWKDDIVAEKYSAEDRYFFLYILTNAHSKQCGIYHLPIRIIAFEMGHSKESIESIIDRFENKYKNIIYNKDTQEIAILNFLKHSIMKGGKPVEDCIKKELELIKDKNLIVRVYNHMENYMNEHIAKKKLKEENSMYLGIKNIFQQYINTNNIIINNINKTDNIDINNINNENESIVTPFVNDSLCDMIIEYLNLKANTNFRKSSKKTKQLINARLQEKFTFNDFTKVIDNKVADWKGNAKMEMYLRPETLFGTKFEGYLNQNISNNKQILNDYLQENNNLKPINENSNETLEELEDFFNNKI